MHMSSPPFQSVLVELPAIKLLVHHGASKAVQVIFGIAERLDKD